MREPVASRRSFLIGLLASAAITGTGIKVTKAGFVGDAGKAIQVLKRDWEMARQLLMEDAKGILPQGTIYDIRMSLPSDYGRNSMMGWYANTAMQNSPLDDSSELVWKPDGGYYLFGRYQCP